MFARSPGTRPEDEGSVSAARGRRGRKDEGEEASAMLNRESAGRKRDSESINAVQSDDLLERRIPTIHIVTPTYERPTQIADLTRVAYSLLLGGPNLHWIIVEDIDNGASERIKQFIESIESLVISCCPCRGQRKQKRLNHFFIEKENNNCCYTPSSSDATGSGSAKQEVPNVKKETCCCSCTCSNLVITHLTASTPVEYKLKSSKPNWLKPRGVAQRNRAILWLKDHHKHDAVKDKSNDGGSGHRMVDDRGSEGQDTYNSSRNVSDVIYFADDDNTYDVRLFDEMRYTDTVSIWPVGIRGGR